MITKDTFDRALLLQDCVIAQNPDMSFDLLCIGDQQEGLVKLNTLIETSGSSDLIVLGDRVDDVMNKINKALELAQTGQDQTHTKGLAKISDVDYIAEVHKGEAFVEINGEIHVIIHVEDSFFITKRDNDTYAAMTVRNNELVRMAGYPEAMSLDDVIDDARAIVRKMVNQGPAQSQPLGFLNY